MKKGLRHLQNAQQFIAQEGLEVCNDIYRQELCEMAISFIGSNRNRSNLRKQSKVILLYCNKNDYFY